MHFSYRLRHEGSDWIAETESVEAEGHGPSPGEALLDLREVLAERFAEHAVAPPEVAPRVFIDLEPIPQTIQLDPVDVTVEAIDILNPQSAS